MALNELTLLINRCRKLQENNENGENEDRIDEIRDKIADLLSESDEKVTITCSYEREVCMKDYYSEDYFDWIIDKLVDTKMSQEEIMVEDIRDNLDSYVTWDDITVTIKDKHGNELDSFC